MNNQDLKAGEYVSYKIGDASVKVGRIEVAFPSYCMIKPAAVNGIPVRVNIANISRTKTDFDEQIISQPQGSTGTIAELSKQDFNRDEPSQPKQLSLFGEEK
jgi:hypothetical protein